MQKTTFRLCFALLLVGALSACESVTLVQLNNDFFSLSEQAVDVDRRQAAGEFDGKEFDTLAEVNQLSFAELGDKAVDAAEEADSIRSKVSLLNLAVRSYLNSGPVADTNIPGLVQQGVALCNRPELQGLNALPVTCGYFHIANAQAINNEAQRDVAEVIAKPGAPGGTSTLSADDGIVLRMAFGRFLQQSLAIHAARTQIDLSRADPRFGAALDRQKIILFCNAFMILGHYSDVEPVGPGWDREAARNDSREEFGEARETLAISSPTAACL